MSATPKSVWRNPIHFLAFGLGSGTVPRAPGTFGTLAALVLYLVLPDMTPFAYAVFLLAGFLLGIWICGKTARDIGVHDHGGIVWDEFIGFWLTMFLAPPGLFWLLAGFVLFRVFDIIKPWPIRWFDRHVHGGFGIMIDDVLAGVMAWMCLQLMAAWIL